MAAHSDDDCIRGVELLVGREASSHEFGDIKAVQLCHTSAPGLSLLPTSSPLTKRGLPDIANVQRGGVYPASS